MINLVKKKKIDLDKNEKFFKIYFMRYFKNIAVLFL